MKLSDGDEIEAVFYTRPGDETSVEYKKQNACSESVEACAQGFQRNEGQSLTKRIECSMLKFRYFFVTVHLYPSEFRFRACTKI